MGVEQVESMVTGGSSVLRQSCAVAEIIIYAIQIYQFYVVYSTVRRIAKMHRSYLSLQ
eukprot:COSAG02_NODE_832_length_16660_cov_16.228006_14_plen_58_part_00